jgi:PhnB protein
MQIHSYLTFNGNCREAMTFYRDCLGGELSFQTIGDSPLANGMPQKMKNTILHASLTLGPLVLLASDMVGANGLSRGNAVSLMLNCNSKEELMRCYDRLSQGGEKTHPVEKTFFGALLGDLIDKYGNQWLLHFKEEK